MKNLTEGNIYKTFILFAVPLVMAGFLSQAYNIIDSIIAGKFLGEAGLAAVGATSAFMSLVSAVFWGFGTGVSVNTGILFGSGKFQALKTSLFSNTAVFIAAHILVSAVIIALRSYIFSFLRIDAKIVSDAEIYFNIYIGGMVFIMLNYFGTYTMHALGMSGFPFRMSILSTALNIGGNLLSVAVLKTGVAGVAVSSVLAALIVDIFYVIKLKKCFEEMGVGDYRAKFSIKAVKKTFGISIPTTIQQCVMYLASFVISPIINGIGSSATAAYSVVLRIYDINAGIYQNSAKTVMNYTAQCVGAEKYDRIRKGVRVGFVQGMVLLFPFLLVSVIFAREFSGMFFPTGFSGEALEYSFVFARYFMPFILFNLINNLFHAFFRGVKAAGLLLTSTALATVARIAATFIFARYYGIYGVYVGWAASWVVEAVYVLAVYWCGMWEKKLNA